MTNDTEYPVLAVDLGGTKTVVALIGPDGRIRDRELWETAADGGPQAVIDRLFIGINPLLDRSNLNPGMLHSICVAAAGIIDIKKGTVTEGPNLPGWRDVPLRDIVSEKYGITAYLMNDADAAALGEHRFGAGKGCNNLVLLTLGTGVGGGIIINGKLYKGTSASAAELGHMVIVDDGPECACGNRGCLESLVSGTAIAREARTRIEAGEKSSLFNISGQPDIITGEKVYQAARKGDSLSFRVITQAGRYLGTGIVNIVNLFSPDMVIIGGSVAQMGDLLIKPAAKVVKERVFRVMAENVRIVPAELGNEAGLVGAAVYALEQ